MPGDPTPTGAARPIDPALVADARDMGIDIASACEAGLRDAIRRARDAASLAAAREAIDEWNGWADTADVPGADARGA